MTYFSQLISFLKSRFPKTIPLDEIANYLHLSQSEVLSLIDELLEKGYPVQTINYAYQFDLPLVNADTIKNDLATRSIGQHIIFEDHTPSTNTLALTNLESLSHGDIILTDYQTNGKGRMGRKWEAGLGTSIAMTIVLKPAIDNKQAVLLTQLTAAALSKSIDSISDSFIKWPNDMIVNNKKVAGILTESQFNGPTLEGVVVGVGINTNLDFGDSDDEIKSKATSLLHETHKTIDPNPLIISFIQWFDELYTNWELSGDSSPFITICKDKSILLNKEITVRKDNTSRLAQVIDINSLGELLIRYKGEETLDSLRSLDFSIRGKDTYI